MSETTKIPNKLYVGTTQKPTPATFFTQRAQPQTLYLSFRGKKDDFRKPNRALKICRDSNFLMTLIIDWYQWPYYTDMTDKKLIFLTEKITRLPSLQFLELRFICCERLTDIGVQKLSEGLKRLSHLRRFRFFCRDCNIQDSGIASLGKALKRLLLLKEIDIGFWGHEKLSDMGLNKFSQGLEKCRSLNKISFHVNGCEKITDAGVENIIRAISKLVTLEEISLCFEGNCKETKMQLATLKESFARIQDLKYLTVLDLTWSKFPCIGDNELIFLKVGLKNMKSLRSLSLDFGDCQKIGDFGFGEICEGIAELEVLKALHLRFPFCHHITDQSLQELGLLLSKMNSLESFSLDLICCWSITEVGLESLKEGLMKLGNIKKIHLFFYWGKTNEDKKKKYEQKLKDHFITAEISLEP